jgi:WD40 repeat protein
VLTGGDDGIVRVWTKLNKAMTIQISYHTKEVTAIIPDSKEENIIHSSSVDKSISSYDIKTGKSLRVHYAKNGSILGLAKKNDGERELGTKFFSWASYISAP